MKPFSEGDWIPKVIINELFLFSPLSTLGISMGISHLSGKLPKTTGKKPANRGRYFVSFRLLQDFSHQQLFLLATGLGNHPTLMMQMQKELIRRKRTLDVLDPWRDGGCLDWWIWVLLQQNSELCAYFLHVLGCLYVCVTWNVPWIETIS